MDDRHSMSSGSLRATVLRHGAELASLKGADGVEAIWQAGAPWHRHAPVLFPIVGRLNGDRLRLDGQTYAMGQHGFARDRDFAWLYRTDTACRLVLGDDAESRAVYPFTFRLELEYELAGAGLAMRFRLLNTGSVTLPASMGAHPAFNWPLEPGADRAAHELVFERPEPGPVWNVAGGVLTQADVASPVVARHLPLATRLATDDTTIFHPPASRSVTYGPLGRPALEVAWEGFDQLAVWSRPDADLICIEPWIGFASPAGFDGDFAAKPGLMHLAPGEERTASLTVTLLESAVA